MDSDRFSAQPGPHPESPNRLLLLDLFARTPDGIAFLAPDFTVQSANEAFARQLRLPLSMILDKPVEEAAPGWTEQLGELCRQARETGSPFQAESFAFQFRDHPERGTTHWDLSISPVLSADGGFRGYLLVQRDVTQRVLTQQDRDRQLAELESVVQRVEARQNTEQRPAKELRALTEELQLQSEELGAQSEELARAKTLLESQQILAGSVEQLRTLLEAIDDGIHVKDVEGRYVMVNSEMLRRVGKPREEIIGKTAWEVHDPDHARLVMEQHQEVLRTGRPLEAEVEHPGQGASQVLPCETGAAAQRRRRDNGGGDGRQGRFRAQTGRG